MTRVEIRDYLAKYRYAHRGLHSKPEIPENSLAAFRRAVENGFGMELDVHLMKDGNLAVIHDSTLKRCTGADGIVEELDIDGLSSLRLEGTDEKVPLLSDFLKTVDGKVPFILELKTYGKNHLELVEAVIKELIDYKGVYCIESFDPYVLLDYKKLAPEIYRGQLTWDFLHNKSKAVKSLSYPTRFILAKQFFNILSKPDFIAVKYQDRSMKSVQRYFRRGVQMVTWTITSKEDMLQAESENSLVIFENFVP